MTRDHTRYIAIEAAIGAAFGGVFGMGFCVLLFGGGAQVPVYGSGLMLDAIPQNFMTTLPAVLFPTISTRKRLLSGRVAALQRGAAMRPKSAVLRAIVLACIVMVVAGGLTAAILSLGPAVLPFGPVIIAKTVYGMLLGSTMAGIATRLAFADAPQVMPHVKLA